MSHISDRVGDGHYSFNGHGISAAPYNSDSVFRTNVIELATQGNRVIVRGDGVKKAVQLYPTNGQNDSKRYVLHELMRNGLRPNSAIVNIIADELDRLRREGHLIQ